VEQAVNSGSGKMERYRSRAELKPSETAAKPGPKPVRGRPFQRGNPGRPPGAKNKTTRLLEELIAGEAENVVRKALELAVAGNAGCIRILIDRLLPRRNGRPIDFSLPAVNDIHDVVAAMAAIATAVNEGRLTAEEAAQLVGILNSYEKILATNDLTVRLEAVESRLKQRP
jgi:hypothetical protein